MKMTYENAWVRLKTALECAVVIDAGRGESWLAANEQATIQTLSTRLSSTRRYSHDWLGVLLGDIVERNVGLHTNVSLPDPPNDTSHYKQWVRMNCFRLSERLRALGDDVDEFSWLRREYLRQYGRLVK